MTTYSFEFRILKISKRLTAQCSIYQETKWLEKIIFCLNWIRSAAPWEQAGEFADYVLSITHIFIPHWTICGFFLWINFISFLGAEIISHIALESPTITSTNTAEHTGSAQWIVTYLLHREAGNIIWLNWREKIILKPQISDRALRMCDIFQWFEWDFELIENDAICNFSRGDVCGGRGEINRIRESVL